MNVPMCRLEFGDGLAGGDGQIALVAVPGEPGGEAGRDSFRFPLVHRVFAGTVETDRAPAGVEAVGTFLVFVHRAEATGNRLRDGSFHAGMSSHEHV